jgi:hypothetical protein
MAGVQGIKLGVSSRGWASLVQDPASKAMCVDEDFEVSGGVQPMLPLPREGGGRHLELALSFSCPNRPTARLPLLQLITFDFVTEPSNKGAFLVPISTRYRWAGQAAPCLQRRLWPTLQPSGLHDKGNQPTPPLQRTLVSSWPLGRATAPVPVVINIAAHDWMTGVRLPPLCCRRAVPDQTRGVAVAHLGLGAITMHNLPLLPTAQSMGRRVAHALWQAQKEEQRLAQQQQEQQQQPAQDAAGDAPGLLLQQQPRAAGSAGALGDGPCHSPPAAAAQPPQQPQPQQVLWVDPPGSVLMLGNHYITGVQSPAAPEGAAREYKRHLSEFATRAHLACSQGYTYPKGGSRSEPKQVGSIMADASSHQQQQQQQQPAGADACSDSSRTPGSAMAAAPAGPAALATEATAAALEAGPAALKAEQLRPPPPAAQPPQQPPQQATGERSWRGMLSTSQRVQPQELLPGMAEANTGASLEVACCSATEGQAQQQSCCDAGASGAGLECDTELGAASGGRLRHGSSSSVASHTLAGNPGIAMVASAGDAGSAASRSLAADAGGASAHASTPCQPPDKVQLPPGKPTTAGDPTAAAPLLDGQAATPAPSPGSTSPLYAAVKSTLLAYSRRRKAQQALMQGS